MIRSSRVAASRYRPVRRSYDGGQAAAGAEDVDLRLEMITLE